MTPSVSPEELMRLDLLLASDETDVPPLVVQTYSFLKSLGIRFRLSRNEMARSCMDASNKRHRGGRIGIPLYDELKSLYCGYTDHRSRFVFLIAHCRADRRVNFRSVQQLLGARSRPQLLSREKLYDLGLECGIVNPFEDANEYAIDGRFMSAPVLHVFDEDVLASVSLPGTMMTNAGSLTWAVEFWPREFVAAMEKSLEKVVVGDIGMAEANEVARRSYQRWLTR